MVLAVQRALVCGGWRGRGSIQSKRGMMEADHRSKVAQKEGTIKGETEGRNREQDGLTLKIRKGNRISSERKLGSVLVVRSIQSTVA